MIASSATSSLPESTLRQEIIERHRRHSVVRGGNDQGGVGGGERGRRAADRRRCSVLGPRGTCKLARLAAWRGSTGSAQPRTWRRSGRRSVASSPMPCWLRSCPSRRRSWDRRSTVSLRPVCCSGRACRRKRLTSSSMLWCRMPPMARCCVSRGAALHARIAETLESQFAEIAESRPELLARHCTEAALIEKAAGLWGKAGQRSLERSALVEAVVQFTRALEQIAALPATPALRREQIKLQVGLANTLITPKATRAAETKAAFDHARAIDRASGSIRRAPRRPALAVLRALRFLHTKVYRVRRRCCTRAGDAIPYSRGAAESDGSHHDRASSAGQFVTGARRRRRRLGPSRSRSRTLRSGRASSAGDAIWP